MSRPDGLAGQFFEYCFEGLIVFKARNTCMRIVVVIIIIM